MAGIFGSIFGSKFPDTGKYEAAQIELRENFRKFQEISESTLLKRYLELDHEVHSGDFEKRVDELKNKKFKDTQQYQQLKRFKELDKSKDIKTYLKLSKSGQGKKTEEILESDKFKRFRELEKYTNSPEFYKAKASSDFKKSEAHDAYKEYKRLKNDHSIKWAIKSEKSSAYQTFKKLEDSQKLTNFFELKATIESKEFKDFKDYMEDKHRFKKSDEAALLNEFSDLKKNKDIVWYLKTKQEKPFEEFKKWEITFQDDFDKANLDRNKWITGYYWGKALMNDTYSLENEKQLFSDSNVELRDSNLRITTQRETAIGKAWNPSWGFREKEFNFTSGLVSTGQSFRQQYGRFEAKVRFNASSPIVNAFWMVGEKMTPHIDIFKSVFSGGKALETGVISKLKEKELTEARKRIKGANFTKDYYIYSLDWSPKELVWKINGVEVFRQTKNIPEEPMYLSFSTILPEEPKEKDLPAIMEINWVRCYKHI
ncbi:glycoside hydrolase family 16 protein [Marinilabilia rubra]|uniref:Glycoside hydrolase family 16 n=1 Tax=Marinilabilia rubra TaxID=2162893 RepID=A0A2U2BAM1_9BACT|nr:glycoside hydrolase family 16 protein [Marinilabilia rubra]PWE00077.1 glycoside hydrolase family 16 [Marinilabilia rubra]